MLTLGTNQTNNSDANNVARSSSFIQFGAHMEHLFRKTQILNMALFQIWNNNLLDNWNYINQFPNHYFNYLLSKLRNYSNRCSSNLKARKLFSTYTSHLGWMLDNSPKNQRTQKPTQPSCDQLTHIVWSTHQHFKSTHPSFWTTHACFKLYELTFRNLFLAKMHLDVS